MSLPSWMGGDYTECQPANLDIFSTPDIMTAIERVSYVDVRPVSQVIGGNSPLEFLIGMQGSQYCDLSKTKLFLNVKIVHSDGSTLQADEKVAPVNSFMHSLFSQMDVYINSKLVSTSGDLYPYLAYFKTLFSTTSVEKKALLRRMLWVPDSAGFLSSTDPKAGNSGLFDRSEYVKNSRTVDMVSIPLNDVFDIKRYLINGCDLKINMYRNKPEFALMADTSEPNISGYRIVIEDCFIRVCKLTVNPAIILAHTKLMKTNSTAIYPLVKREVRSASISSNQMHFIWDHLFNSVVPRTVVVALVASSSVLGSYIGNPYEFQNFNLRKIGLYVNGTSCPSVPMTADFNRGHVVEIYSRLYDASNAAGLDVQRDDIGAGMALYVFQLQPPLSDREYFTLVSNANCRLDIEFGAPLPVTVSCLLYSESDHVIHVDEARNVTTS